MIQKGVCVLLFFCLSFVLIIKFKENKEVENKNRIAESQKIPKALEGEEYLLEYKNYKEIVNILKTWESKSPDLVDVGFYGKTNKGTDSIYVKITNEFDPGKEVVLLTACIHGNEPWSTSTMLGYIGKLLSCYGKDERITKILNEKTIYFIPVVSPDTYGKSRYVEGVDPNRNFPTLSNENKESIKSIQNLREFFLEIKPNAVLSGHTYGRVLLIPWGDETNKNPNYEDYKKIANKMAELAEYDYKRICELYGHPIYGTESDWYHRNGAFAIVMEFGTHQKHPSLEDTKSEFNRTLNSVLFFIEESTKIEIKN